VESLGYGDFIGYHINKYGKEIEIKLQGVIYAPSLWVNLFSITKATKTKGVKVICEDDLITVYTNQEEIHFNKVLKHGSGSILASDFYTDSECASPMIHKATYKDFHELLGHPHKQKVYDTAKIYGIKLSTKETDPVCEDCAISKIRVKNFGHSDDTEATEIGERISIDITSIPYVSYGGAKFWFIIMDHYSEYCWSYFLSAKSEVTEKFIVWAKEFQKEYKVNIKNVRCDNAGEHITLEAAVKADNDLHINFEFSAPHSPQNNGKIERKIATLWGKVRSMLNDAKLPTWLRQKLWAQCAQHATRLENVIPITGYSKTPHQVLNNTDYPSWFENLHKFGEIAVVHDGARSKIRAKLQDRGFHAMFIGYPPNHSGEVCQFLNLSTQKVINSRSSIFLHKMFGDYYQMAKEAISHVNNTEEPESLTIEETYTEEPFQQMVQHIPPALIDNEDEDDEEMVQQVTARGARELRNLQTFYNPDPLQYVQQHAAVMATFRSTYAHHEIALQATIYDGSPDPKSYSEAKASADWPNWKGTMDTEFDNMHEKQVWTITKRSTMDKGRKIIGNRWVYVLKDDGRYRARTVAKGFTQIPGKDFQENHSPVVNDTTFHTILVLKIMLKLEAGQFDIETAFLYGELEEKLWMDLPEGYVEYIQEKIANGKENEIPIQEGIIPKQICKQEYCLELKKAIYGLVQAARQWWKKFKKVIEGMDYKQSAADPCLFVKHGKNGEKNSFIIIYVDDGGIFSTEDNIQGVIAELSKTFKVKYLGKLENFIGCKLIENKEKNTIWIHQPKLLKNLKKAFWEDVKDLRKYKTPGTPKTTIVRPKKGEPVLDEKKQKTFRSGVGMLLYLVKHSRPDISNAVRELSKVSDGATYGHLKELYRCIKYVLDTYGYALKLCPTIKDKLVFNLMGLSDASMAEDKDNRLSVYGYILYLNDAPIATKSKLGRSVVLSSTEAEYFALSEVAKEILFAKQLLETCGINVELPIIVRVDNVGAIFLTNNFSVSQRTKHIDTRTHFVREYVEDDIVKIIFIRSEDNTADIFTKNTSEDTFVRQSSKFIEDTKIKETT
jgi:hypothetical protein